MSLLTLSIDDDLVSQAESYARSKGTDLSVLVANWLRSEVAKIDADKPALPPELAALYGCISLPAGYDYKEDLGDVFLDRNGR